MTITTKLNIGDKVFFLQCNKVYTTEITNIVTKTELNSFGVVGTTNHYVIAQNPAGSQYSKSGFTENELFKTKQELLDTL